MKLILSKECAERGCMAHDDRVDGTGVVVERQPLTDEEVWKLAAGCLDSVAGRLQFARAIERAHGIGGGE